jgi:heme exporter protein A
VSPARHEPASDAPRHVDPLDFDRVAAEDVSRHFGRRRALSHVSFEVRTGRILGLLGPNGAGKSTMLAVLATLLTPTTGTIRYGTLDAPGSGSSSPEHADGSARVDGATLRSRIGVLGHDLFLYPELSARENLTFFAGVHGVSGPGDAAERALAGARLDDRGDDPVSSFSRGMRQRLALERALIHDPRLVLLDEPFTGLDDASTAGFVTRLESLRSGGAIVILATHDLDLADGLLDAAVFLREGRTLDTVSQPSGLRAIYRDVMRGTAS